MKNKKIPIFEPYIKGNARKYLMDCIETNWISSQGEYIIKLEKALSDFHNVKHAIVTSNCTTALHLSIKSLNLGPGDEIICPDLTFIAPANMIVLSGAKLVLVDIDPETLTINLSDLEDKINDKTKAIMVVHHFGHSAHMDEIMQISAKHKLKIIEDNAECIGGKYKNKLLGTIGDVATLSFFGNKIITTGEGGAVLTNNKEIAERCKMLRDHGMSPNKKYLHLDLGYNYRMTNMQAAIGLSQVENLNLILNLRTKQMENYYTLLSNISEISLRKFSNWCTPAHWLMTIMLESRIMRNNFIEFMANQGVECRPMINPVHQALHFKDKFNGNDFPNSEYVSSISVHLPSSTNLSFSDMQYISDKIKEFFK